MTIYTFPITKRHKRLHIEDYIVGCKIKSTVKSTIKSKSFQRKHELTTYNYPFTFTAAICL